jgi:cytochrome c peroxidase
MDDYFADHRLENKAGLGRFNVTGDESDKHRFKVPSLRLAVLTAPYFHNGAHASLAEVIRTMAKYQLGRDIPADDIRSIIRFLYALPGEYKGKSLEPEEKKHLDFSDQPATGEQH